MVDDILLHYQLRKALFISTIIIFLNLTEYLCISFTLAQRISSEFIRDFRKGVIMEKDLYSVDQDYVEARVI